MNIDDIIKNTPLDNSVPNSPIRPVDQTSNINTQSNYSDKKEIPQEPSTWQKVKEGALDTSTGIINAVQPQVEGLINLATPKGSEISQILEQRNAQRQREWDLASQRSPVLSRIGYWGSLFTAGAAVPGGVSGSLAQRVGTGALSGAALGATQYTPDDTAAKIAGRSVVGGLLGGAVPVGVATISGMKNAVVPGAAQGAKQAAEAVGTTAAATGAQEAGKITNPVMEAAQRQGINISPAQALDSPALAAEIGGRKVPFSTRLQMTEAANKAEQQVREKVGSTIESMVPEGTKAAKKTASDLYAKIRDIKLNTAALGDVQSNTAYQDAYKAVEKNFPDLNPVSVGFQQKVAESMYDTAAAMKREANPDNFKIQDILENRRMLVNQIGREVPEYRQAQHIWERIQLQKDLTDQLGSRKVLAGRSDLTPAQIRSTLAGSEEQKYDFLMAIRRAGGNTQQAEDVLSILESLSRPSGFKGVINEATTGGVNANPKAQLWENITARVGGREKRDQGFVNLIMDPKWSDKVSQILKTKNPHELTDKLSQTLIKASTTAGLQSFNRVQKEDRLSQPEQVQDEQGLIATMPLGFKQERAMQQSKEQQPKQDYDSNSITGQVLQSPEDRKKMQEAVAKLPEDKQDEIDKLLNMSPEDFYKSTLSTKEGQAKYLKTLRDKGYDISKAYQHIKQIEQLDALNKKADAKLAEIQDPKQQQQIIGGMHQRTQQAGGLLGALFSLFASIFTGSPVGVFGSKGNSNINSYKTMSTEELEVKAAQTPRRGGLLTQMGNQGIAEARLELKRRARSEKAQEKVQAVKEKIEAKKEGLLTELMTESMKPNELAKETTYIKKLKLRQKLKEAAGLGKKTVGGIKKVKIKF